MTQPSWLKAAVRKSREHAWTLGHLFEAAHRIEGLSPEDLAAELGCSLETLDYLALCRRPDEDRFAEDLHLITDRFHLDPRPLKKLIRRVESLEAFDPGEARDTSLGAVLLAARDRADDDETES